VRPNFWYTGRIKLVYGAGDNQMRSQMRNSAGSKVLWHIDFLDETHHPSCRSVACVNGARLERSLEG